MVTGTVSFSAKITGNGLSFGQFEFAPGVPNLTRLEVDATDGYEIDIVAHVDQTASEQAAWDLAQPVITKMLDRLAFAEGVIIQQARATDSALQRIENGIHMVAGSVNCSMQGVEIIREIPSARIKKLFESPWLPGEHNYALIRYASQSRSPVEEFTHLYTLLLTFYNDNQSEVDAFIIALEPNVLRTPKPVSRQGAMETVYTRLRNELAHRRAGADMAKTKEQATAHVSGLRTLVKQAIEAHP